MKVSEEDFAKLAKLLKSTPEELRGGNRNSSITLKRKFLCKYLHDNLNLSNREIGELLEIDHSTSSAARGRLDELISLYEDTRMDYEQFEMAADGIFQLNKMIEGIDTSSPTNYFLSFQKMLNGLMNGI